MTVIGLCGGSGSGKTTAAGVMASCGAAVIDTDRVYRELCTPGSRCLSELEAAFGERIITHGGGLDRAALGKMIFSDACARRRLNTISHKYIREKTEQLLSLYESEGYPAAVVDAPLLFESGFDALCDVTVGITAERGLRISRIVSRDGITPRDAEKRIASQLSDEVLRMKCDTIIENDGDADGFSRRVREFYKAAVGGR